MRNLLLTLFVIASNYGFSQSFSYRFKGSATTELSSKIENELLHQPGFTTVKFKIKEQSGELLFVYSQPSTVKGEATTSPISVVKDILINNGLEPFDVVEIH